MARHYNANASHVERYTARASGKAESPLKRALPPDTPTETPSTHILAGIPEKFFIHQDPQFFWHNILKTAQRDNGVAGMRNVTGRTE
jgi:hypothetical protein